MYNSNIKNIKFYQSFFNCITKYSFTIVFKYYSLDILNPFIKIQSKLSYNLFYYIINIFFINRLAIKSITYRYILY